MTTIRTLLALLGSVGLAAASFAEPPGHGPGHFEHAIERLDLDDETGAAVQAILDESRLEGRALHEQMAEARAALRALLDEDPPDEASILAQAEEVGALETEATKHRLRTMLRIRALLTPEQAAELADLPHRHRGGCKMGACPGDGGGPCPHHAGNHPAAAADAAK